MKVFIVYLLIFTGSTIGDELCERSPFNICNIPNFKIPENFEDLNYLCPNLILYIDCLGNYNDNCHSKPESTNVFLHGNIEFQSVRNLGLDICDEESNMHAAVFDNIRCLKENFFSHDGACYDLKDQALDELNNATRSQEDEVRTYPLKSCISRFYDMGCFLYFVGENCGQMSRDAALDIIRRSYFLRNSCIPDIKTQVLNHIEEMDFNSSQNANLKDAFVDAYSVAFPT